MHHNISQQADNSNKNEWTFSPDAESVKVTPRMSKANSVYFVMICAFALGLWTILSFGSIFLHAPPDLAGKWELRSADATSNSPPAHTIIIQQSGLFLQIDLDGKDHSLKMIRQQVVQKPTRFDESLLELTGSDLQMTFQGRCDADAYHLQTRGSLAGDWDAIRTVRTYPKKLADQPATRAVADAR